jgi:hypothetical protein
VPICFSLSIIFSAFSLSRAPGCETANLRPRGRSLDRFIKFTERPREFAEGALGLRGHFVYFEEQGEIVPLTV